MAFRHDSTGVKPSGGFEPIPAGAYDLEIDKVEEGVSKKSGYPMVKVTCVVINNPKYDGRKIFHNVVFIPKTEKGAGMAVHWLKTINQPFEGEYIVNPEKWLGQRFLANVTVDEYQGKKNNKIGSVLTYDYTQEPIAKEEISF